MEINVLYQFIDPRIKKKTIWQIIKDYFFSFCLIFLLIFVSSLPAQSSPKKNYKKSYNCNQCDFDVAFETYLIFPYQPLKIIKKEPKVTKNVTFSLYNHFPWGQCTWWVAHKRSIPWRGNAGQWLIASQKVGYNVGYLPTKGAIAVWQGNPGHVAYVEWVKSDGSFGISEMNYFGFGKINYRSFLSVSKSGIAGFIY